MTNDSIALIIIFLLTLNLLVVGTYVVLVLKEVRRTMQTVNRALETVDTVADSFVRPIVGASGFLTGLTHGLSALKDVRDALRHESSVHEKK